jgi:hypothetical protein
MSKLRRNGKIRFMFAGSVKSHARVTGAFLFDGCNVSPERQIRRRG